MTSTIFARPCGGKIYHHHIELYISAHSRLCSPIMHIWILKALVIENTRPALFRHLVWDLLVASVCWRLGLSVPAHGTAGWSPLCCRSAAVSLVTAARVNALLRFTLVVWCFISLCTDSSWNPGFWSPPQCARHTVCPLTENTVQSRQCQS